MFEYAGLQKPEFDSQEYYHAYVTKESEKNEKVKHRATQIYFGLDGIARWIKFYHPED